MTLSLQLLLKLDQSLNDLVEKAFLINNEITTEVSSKSDFIRKILKEKCLEIVLKQGMENNPYVKDDLLNKLIWVIISRNRMATLEAPYGKLFRALHIKEFAPHVRLEIEDLFRLLKKENCLDYEKNHQGKLVAFDFNINALLDKARSNVDTEKMLTFIENIKKWGTIDNNLSIDHMCFISFGEDVSQIKKELSYNGFITTKESKTIIPTGYFVREFVNDSPTYYARQLWNIPGSDKSPDSIHITFPDIYI